MAGALYERRLVGLRVPSRVVSSEPIAGTRACSRDLWPSRGKLPPWKTTLTSIPWPFCTARADFRERIRLSQEMVERSQELVRRIDDLLAKSPLKP
jgi:hypothetical protein